MREFKVSNALLASVSNVLTRRGVEFQITQRDGQYYCHTNISGTKFHKCIVRAKCEQITKDRNSSIPYIAHSELEDDLVKEEIGNVYVVLEKK